jgi:hypothetical protein
VKRAVQGSRKFISGEKLIAAWAACLDDPESRREDFKYVPALHRWIAKGKFEAWLPKAKNLFSDASTEQPSELEHAFKVLSEHGEWLGHRYGFSVDPRSPKADYDSALYRKYGIKVSEEAA